MVAEEIALENREKMLEGYSKEKCEEKASFVQKNGESNEKKSFTLKFLFELFNWRKYEFK